MNRKLISVFLLKFFLSFFSSCFFNLLDHFLPLSFFLFPILPSSLFAYVHSFFLDISLLSRYLLFYSLIPFFLPSFLPSFLHWFLPSFLLPFLPSLFTNILLTSFLTNLFLFCRCVVTQSSYIHSSGVFVSGSRAVDGRTDGRMSHMSVASTGKYVHTVFKNQNNIFISHCLLGFYEIFKYCQNIKWKKRILK